MSLKMRLKWVLEMSFTMILKKIDYVELVNKKINKIIPFDDVEYVIPFAYSEETYDKIRNALARDGATDVIGQRVQQYEHIKDTSGDFNRNSFENVNREFYSPKEDINVAFIDETTLLRNVNQTNVDVDYRERNQA